VSIIHTTFILQFLNGIDIIFDSKNSIISINLIKVKILLYPKIKKRR